MASVTRGLRIVLTVSLIGIEVVSGARPALAQQTTTAPSLDRWQGFIAEASRRFGIPASWIRAVMRAERDGDPRALSPKGAMGLMQIMPATWAELRARYGFGGDPYDPHDSILAGTAYLRELYDRYGYPNLFAAYNAGLRRFDEQLFNGRPLPDETLAYLTTLGQPAFEQPVPTFVPLGTSLFFPLHTATSQVLNPLSAPSSNGLFVPLSTAPERKP